MVVHVEVLTDANPQKLKAGGDLCFMSPEDQGSVVLTVSPEGNNVFLMSLSVLFI